MDSNLSVLIWIIVIGTSIWVFVDAHTIGVKKGMVRGWFDNGAFGWFLGCLLLWIIVFPAYIAKRGEYKTAAALGVTEQSLKLTSRLEGKQKKPIVKFLQYCCTAVATLVAILTVIYFVTPIIQSIMEANLDVNGLPKCDSDTAKDTAKKAVENGPFSKIMSFQIISFEKVEYTRQPPTTNDIQSFCKADVLTNAGKQVIYYTISKTADGNQYYVEVSLLPN